MAASKPTIVSAQRDTARAVLLFIIYVVVAALGGVALYWPDYERGDWSVLGIVGAAAGAAATLLVIHIPVVMIRRAIWARYRGYPFQLGEEVVIRRGPMRGSKGIVLRLGIGCPPAFFVLKLNDPTTPVEVIASAANLRLVQPRSAPLTWRAAFARAL